MYKFCVSCAPFKVKDKRTSIYKNKAQYSMGLNRMCRMHCTLFMYTISSHTEMKLIKFVLMKAFQFQLRAQLLEKLLLAAIQSVKLQNNSVNIGYNLSNHDSSCVDIRYSIQLIRYRYDEHFSLFSTKKVTFILSIDTHIANRNVHKRSFMKQLIDQ